MGNNSPWHLDGDALFAGKAQHSKWVKCMVKPCAGAPIRAKRHTGAVLQA
jgi:hypothetical protein